MSEDKIIDKKQKNKLKHIQEFCLLDDDFMSTFFDKEPECIELVLRIILDKQDLKVEEVKTQVSVANFMHRSVRLDVVATDSKGKKYDVEVQRDDEGAVSQRARYHSSMLDTKMVDKGTSFKDIKESFVIFITENDIFGLNKPVYHIERTILETKELFDDGAHILYVNGAYRDDTPIGKLMYDFSCRESSKMNYKILADRSRYLKESEEGGIVMSSVYDKIYNEIAQDAKEEKMDIVRSMLRNNLLSVNDIVEHFGLSLDEVMDLKEEVDRKDL